MTTTSMTRYARLLLLCGAALGAPLAGRADQGALTFSAGGFVGTEQVPAGQGAATAVTGTVTGVQLGLRYALTNAVELSSTAFWASSGTSYLDNATLPTPSQGTFTGQLQQQAGGWGWTVGARYVHGLEWRFFAGLEGGLAVRTYSSARMVNLSTGMFYDLSIPDNSAACFLLAPTVGIEWAATDHLSFSFAPRAHVYLGPPDNSVGILFPLEVSWSWYL